MTKATLVTTKLPFAGTIGTAAIGDVLILASAKADAGAATFKYVPEAITMNKVDTTVANQQSGLLVRGTVNDEGNALFD